MFRRVLQLFLLATLTGAGVAGAQSFSARRMAMGGVVLAGGGSSAVGANVAYRAVPAAPGSGWALPLPIGLIPLLADPPVLDPDDPDFNVYELANLLYNPPWNLQLTSPRVPGNDVTVEIGKDHLRVDLGEVREVLPGSESRMSAVINGPAAGFGFQGLFVALAPLVYYDNQVVYDDQLRAVIDGTELQPNTSYTLRDQGDGMAAAGAHLGWAAPLMQAGDPRGRGMGLYAGARVKLMRGLAYASTDNTMDLTTGETILEGSLDANYVGHSYTAGPDGGGLGRGLDLGAVWMAAGAEVGVGVNDVGTTFDWRTRETIVDSDPDTPDYRNEDVARTSHVPATAVANAAMKLGRLLVAADVVRGIHVTTGHLGAETWLCRSLALRAGAGLDANALVQYSGGAGLRLGSLGLDLAVASHSRNLSRERCLELGAGLAFYR